MNDGFTQADGSLTDQLVAACGVGELAAAAAIDAEEGDRFLHARLADQMAGAHLLTMRMAALADRAISAAAEGVDRGTANLPLFDLAAARFAGAAARLNGRYCRGLQTLRTLAGPDAEDEEVRLIAISSDPEPVPPEEMTRRINRAESYLKLRAPEKPSKPGPRRRRVDAAEQACLAAAEHAARRLLTETGLQTLASPSNTQRMKLFAHQLAATHQLMMRLTGRADIVVTAAVDPLDRPEGLRLAHGAARLMERFRQGVAMLHRLRTAPDRPRRVAYISTDQFSDYEREQERAEDLAHGIDPDTGLPISPTAASSAATRPPTPLLSRRGRLKNGNPGGDFLAAARCGAKTRAGCACRQPAMANGRCRFHGGKSTGPRTAQGVTRARRARLVHGLRSGEIIALSAAAAAAHRRLGTLIAAARQKPEARTQKPEGQIAPSADRSLASDFGLPASGPAGHGVHRSESSTAARSAVVLPFARPMLRGSTRASPPRGRGKSPQSPCRNWIPRVQP